MTPSGGMLRYSQAGFVPQPHSKRPGPTARAFMMITDKRSGGGLVEFRSAGLDRLDGLGGDLLAEFGELLAWR